MTRGTAHCLAIQRTRDAVLSRTDLRKLGFDRSPFLVPDRRHTHAAFLSLPYVSLGNMDVDPLK
jgi:hypothetical protein